MTNEAEYLRSEAVRLEARVQAEAAARLKENEDFRHAEDLRANALEEAQRQAEEEANSKEKAKLRSEALRGKAGEEARRRSEDDARLKKEEFWRDALTEEARVEAEQERRQEEVLS